MSFLKNVGSKRLTIVFFSAIIAGLFLVFALNAYPVPAGDSLFFIVPAVHYAAHGNLVSPLFPSGWAIDNIIDTTGARRFLFYPPLFPLTVSVLMPSATASGAFWAIAFINGIVILLSAFLFYKVARRKGDLDWSMIFLIVLALFALAASVAETGRPEVLARLWIVLAALVPFYISQKYRWIFFGVLLGLLFATHPPAGVFSLFILGMYWGVTLKQRDIFIHGSVTLLLGAIVGLGAIALGPFGVRETIEGTYLNAVVIQHVVENQGQPWLTIENVIRHYVASPVAPFYGAVLLLLLVGALLWYRGHRIHIASPFVVLVSCAFLIALFLRITYTMGHVFYLTLFAPLIFGFFISIAPERGFVWKAAAVAVFLLVATGFFRTALLFPSFLDQAATLESARARFHEIRTEYAGESGSIGITGGFWTLTEDYNNVYIYALGEKLKENTAVMFFQQRYSGLKEPPEVSGCTVTEDTFSRETPTFLGIKLANTMPGYGYAIYRC